jgi:hypothetical protein
MVRKRLMAVALSLCCVCSAVAQPLPPPIPSEIQAAQRAADDAAREAEKLRLEADKAEKDKKIARAQRDAARKAAERALAAAKTAQQHLKDAEKHAKALAASRDKAIHDAAAAMAKQRQQMLWELGGAAGCILLLALAGGILLARSRGRRKRAEVDAGVARREAMEAVTPVPGASDLLLEGVGGGAAMALKIPAIALNPQTGGAVIGRSPQDTAFVINHPSVSRRHCRMVVEDGVLQVKDLQSTNGTAVNGQTIAGSGAPIGAGDTLTLGEVQLKVRKI